MCVASRMVVLLECMHIWVVKCSPQVHSRMLILEFVVYVGN
jgi:hypothetical protein